MLFRSQGGDTEILEVTATSAHGGVYDITTVANQTGMVYLVLRVGENEIGRIKVSVVPTSSNKTTEQAVVAPMVAAGNDFTLALTSDGKVYSWGTYANGVLGRTVLDDGGLYGQVVFGDDDKEIKYIAAGDMHALAVDVDGNLWAWGYNEFGQVGNGTAAPGDFVGQPVKILEDKSIVAVSAGNDHSLALDEKGQVWAWGRNHHGQVGVDRKSVV